MEKKPGPCAAEKVVKGFYCADDQKDVVESELKDGACPTCGKKPLKVEYCSRMAPGEKTADRARITYACAGCAATAEIDKEFKHEDGCKKRTSALKKVCTKSGHPPHQTIPK